MIIRYRPVIFVAFGLVVLYLLFWSGETPVRTASHAVDVLQGVEKESSRVEWVEPRPLGHVGGGAVLSSALLGSTTISTNPVATSTTVAVGGSTSEAVVSLIREVEGSTTSSASPEASSSSTQGSSSTSGATSQPTVSGSSVLQEDFDKQHNALGQKESAGAIYGNTLNNLINAGSHETLIPAIFKPTESLTPYSDVSPFSYNPYPDYNSDIWRAKNLGDYVSCDGFNGDIADILVFPGHLAAFEEPVVGYPLERHSDICFERQTRLGPYGYDETALVGAAKNKTVSGTKWEKVNWRLLQENCVRKNANRYAPITPPDTRLSSTAEEPPTDTVSAANSHGTGDVRARSEASLHPRTAVFLRGSAGQNYTDNDLQTIRSIVTELSLGSGGEYTIYLLISDNNNHRPLWSDAREDAERVNAPEEFRSMTIVWNQAMMESLYPTAENDGVFHSSEWLPVQRFAHDYPQFEYFWNLELDYRYTGHHYAIFESLRNFALLQPRKGLWERNERFYVPSVHGSYENFRKAVAEVSGNDTIWGAPKHEGVSPVGPTPPVAESRDDDYHWGVGEEADYISLAPIFNPLNTNWTGKNDIWGYVGSEGISRRATVGRISRCSKRLLTVMNADNLHGKYIGSEMAPQTVSLLHGLKAVYAPISIFFDTAWEGSSLNRFLNPGPKGESGSVAESPFSGERETRLEGSTWHGNATVPRRLYHNWMGLEYGGIGGPKWEKGHGRTCLPPMLLRNVKDAVKPSTEHSLKT